MNDYINDVRDDAIYGNTDIFRPQIEGYAWREPYIDMLQVLSTQGMVAAPQAHTASFNNRFSDPSLYSAIINDFWCHDGLRQLLKSDSFPDKWWQGLVNSIRFIEESELMPLYVQYTRGVSTFENNNTRNFLETLANERHLKVSDLYDTDELKDRDNIDTPIPYMKWCTYDFSWYSNVPGNHWTEGSSQLYLRRGIRDEYIYGGAYSAYRCVVDEASWLSGSYTIHNIKNKNGVISSSENYPPQVEATAAAKPLGYLEENGIRIPPNSIEMILPVFISARLIPTKLPPADNSNKLGSKERTLYKFLLWCDSVDDINAPNLIPPPGAVGYLLAFQKLNDPLWRHSGWNPSYIYNPPGEVIPYDSNSDTGAGYLQQPASNPNIKGSDGYTYDNDENIIGVSYTNDDLCDWSPPGGNSSATGGGGPGSLH